MKTTSEQTTDLINASRTFTLRIDRGAFCFFILGMFLTAMIFNSLGIFSSLH